MKKSAIVLAVLLTVFGSNKTQEEINTERPAEEILQSFVEDFRKEAQHNGCCDIQKDTKLTNSDLTY